MEKTEKTFLAFGIGAAIITFTLFGFFAGMIAIESRYDMVLKKVTTDTGEYYVDDSLYYTQSTETTRCSRVK